MIDRTLSHRPLDAWVRDLLAGAAGLGALAPLAVLANPTGGQVVGGNATISNIGANGTVVTQGSQSAIINWQQFSIGSGQYVQFVQPNSSAVVLNRVTGGNVSQILGTLSANGQVFLVNPNGIFFGRAATLDVQGMVASTLDINDSDFMAGHYVFRKGTGAPDAQVVNEGAISAGPSGYVVLAGDYVENDGRIDAQAGHVVLAASGQATLTLDQNQLVSYVVNGATLAQLAGVTNTGNITADGGGVLMTADVANALTATAVNNSGLVAAHSVQTEGGVIVLAAQGGGIENSGTLDASATQAGVAGGSVVVKAEGRTQLTDTSVIDTEGDGAMGGHIEVSGHGLSLRGRVTTGRGGDLLLDPFFIHIVNGSSNTFGASTNNVGVGWLDSHLGNGTNVTLFASNSIQNASHAARSINESGAGSLTLKTNAGGAIDVTGLTINIKGAFTASAAGGLVTVANVTAAGGITLTGSRITAGSLSASAGAVQITGQKTASGNTTINQTGTIKGKKVTVSEILPSSAGYGGSISLGNVQATSSSISITAVTTASQRMNISVGNLTAGKAVKLGQEGHSGGISFGNVSAGSSAGGPHAGLTVSTKLTGPSAGGGNVNGGTITVTGGVQIVTDGGSHSGAKIHVANVSGKYIHLNASANRGADISAGTLQATGNSGSAVSLIAHANGGASSSGGNIRTNAITTTLGGVHLDALGGVDSGGDISVRGAISAGKKVGILAVGEGSCCDGNVSIQGAVKGQFIDIQALTTNTAATSGARISIGGNITATGTAPVSSPSLGVNLRAGTPSAAGGNPSITVDGNIKASHGAVNLFVFGNHGGRSIAVHGAGGSNWGSIKAQRVHIGVQGGGSSGNIDVGAITTLGSGASGDASIQTTGNGGSVHIGVHGSINVAGSSLYISNFGNAAFRSVNVSGAIHVTGASGNVNLSAINSASYGGAAVTASNVTATARASLYASGRGTGGATVTVGNMTAGSVSLAASNHGGGKASISAGKLTAPRIVVDASAVAGSSQTAHITLGSLNAVTATGEAFVVVNATGKADTISTGKVTLSGHALASSGEVGPQPVGALFQVTTHGGASDSINIGGAVKVTALGTVGSNALGDAVVEIGAFAGASSTAPVANAPVTVGGSLTVNAARDVQLFVHGSVSGAAAVTAARNINETAPGLALNVGGLALQAGNNINLASGSITVGNGAAPGIAGDHAVTKLFGLGSIAPNAALIAGGAVNLSHIGGSASYLLIKAGHIGGIATVTLATGALVQLTATTNTATLGIGNGAGQSQYTVSDISAFSAYNVVLGNSGLTGTLTVGAANLGTTSITLVANGAIKSSGLLSAGNLNLLAGAGAVSLVTSVASTHIVSGTNVKVDDTAFTGNAALSISSVGVGNVSYNFGAGTGTLANNVKVTGGLTLNTKGVLDLSSDSIRAGGAVKLTAAQHILLGNTQIKAGGSFSANAHGSISDGGSGGSITAAGASFKAATGHVVLQGETLNVGAGTLAFSAAGSVGLGSATIHAGNVTIATAGNLSMTGAAVNAAGLQAVTGGSIDMSGDTIVVSGTVKLTAGFISSTQALAAKDIVLSGINLTAGVLEASAGGTIHNGGTTGTINAGALALIAGHNINLSSTQINVGSGSVSGVVGDPSAGLILLGAGLGGTGAFPNATFIAGGSIQLAGLAYNGKTTGYRTYLYLQADQVSIGGTVAFNPGSLIQLVPFTASNTIGIEDTAANGDNTIYLNQGLLGLFAGDTILIGSTATSGNVDIGVNGGFSLSADANGDPTNLIIATGGTVTGLGLVTSTGLVTTLAALAGSEIPPVTSGEIDPTSDTGQGTTSTDDQKKQLLLQAVTGNGPAGGTVSQDTNSGVCH